ncbi:MAG: choice-of-anchor J domain-containing protein, partial [Prevotellaceae bacterium]|nr:choice-of-anchor J domain-containing protein [Prevotellaceae bacterium]
MRFLFFTVLVFAGAAIALQAQPAQVTGAAASARQSLSGATAGGGAGVTPVADPVAQGDPIVLLNEGFEGGVPPAGWISVAESGAARWASYTSYFHSGSRAAYRSFSSGLSIDFLITTPLAIPSGGVFELSFWTMTRDLPYYNKNSVCISTTGTAPADFTEVWTPSIPMVGNIWEEVKLDLSAYAGQTIYIAFRYQGNNAHVWVLDDVKVAEPLAHFLKIQPVYPTTPYSRIPVPQFTSVTAKAQNAGAATRTNVVLSATVNNVVQGSTTPVGTLSPGAVTGDMTLPVTAVVGANRLRATVSADGAEDDASLASFDYAFEGTHNLYALDDIANFTATTRSAATTTMQGVVYHLTAGDTLSAAMVALGSSSSPTTYTVAVYRLINATTVDPTPVMERAGRVKAGGNTAGWTTVNFTPTYLSPGSYYIGLRQTSTYTSPAATTPLVFDGNAAKQSYSKLASGTGLTAITGGYGAAAIRLLFAVDDCGHAYNLRVNPGVESATFYWEGEATYYSLTLHIGGYVFYQSPPIFGYSITLPLPYNEYFWMLTAHNGVGRSCGAAGSTFLMQTCADPVTYFPWTEGFEDASFPPACWTEFGTYGNWELRTGAYAGYSGTHAANHGYSGIGIEDWLVSRPLQIPSTGVYELSFWSQLRDVTYYTGNARSSVLISETGTDPADFTEVWTPSSPLPANSAWSEIKIDLSAYAGKTIYLAFFYRGSNNHQWTVDDISVYKLPDTPEAPTSFTATRRTATAVELSWTNPALTASGVPLTELTVFIERNGAIVYSYNATAAIGQPASWTDNTTATSATYTIYGANNDGAGATATSSFCGTVVAFPWLEDFEGTSGLTLPACWTAQYPGGTSGWRRVPSSGEGNDPEFVFGTGAAYHMWGNSNYNDWLITPAIVLPASGSYELSFWTRNQTDAAYGKNSVWLSTTGNDAAADFTVELWSPATTPVNHEWTEVKVSLTAYAGQQIYIGFRYEGNYAHAVSIDNVRIEELFEVDAAVEAIINPETGASRDAQEPTSVIIRNKGIEPILASSGVVVSIALDGVVIAVEPITVDIAPSATYQHTFAATLDLSAEQSYQVVAVVSLPGDSYAGNDTMAITVVNTGSTATMGSGSPVTGCDIRFYDDGGTANYAASANPVYRETQTMTFFPELPGARIKVDFVSLSLSLPGSYTFPGAGGYTVAAGGDTLYVYDGAVADRSHLIAALCGDMNAQMPLTFQSESLDGALTFVFHKNRGVAAAGWEADVRCFTPAARDLRVTGVTPPPVGKLTTAETVTVNVKNMGGQPAGNVTVILTANCVEYRQAIDPLAVLEERTVVFEQVNLSAPGVYTITAAIDTAAIDTTGDANPGDNTRTTTTKCLANTQTLLFDEDFDPASVCDYTQQIFDNATVNQSAANQGWPYELFTVAEIWWITQMLDSNYALLSNSYVSYPPEQVDRWWITPAIDLSIDARLTWRAGSNAFNFREDYEVRISTTTNTPGVAAFNTVLLSVTAEEPEWTNHEVDLAAYAGQTVYIAFRHISLDKDILWIDDIRVYGIDPDSVCSGDVYRYEPPVVDGAGMSWTRTGTPGINGGAPASGVGFVQEVVTNTTAQPVEVTYTIYTTRNSCLATAQLTVIVLPQLSLTSSLAPAAVCSHETFTYAPTATVPDATFSWRRLPATGILDANGQTSSAGVGDIYEILENNLHVPVTVTYRYTLNSQGCTNTQDIRVVVNPRPTKPNVWTTDGRLAFCAGDSLTLQAESIGAAHYRWVLDETLTP